MTSEKPDVEWVKPESSNPAHYDLIEKATADDDACKTCGCRLASQNACSMCSGADDSADCGSFCPACDFCCGC